MSCCNSLSFLWNKWSKKERSLNSVELLIEHGSSPELAFERDFGIPWEKPVELSSKDKKDQINLGNFKVFQEDE